MKTLHLNLHRRWFDMTESEEKTEDYRELTYYFFEKLIRNPKVVFGGLIGSYPQENTLEERNKCVQSIVTSIFFKDYKYNDFDTVTFSNGYAKNRSQFVVEFKGVEIREGRPEWGAKPGKKYFVIKLGNKL